MSEALINNLTLEEMARFELVPDFILNAAAPNDAKIQERIDDAVYDETETLRKQIHNAQALLDKLENGVDSINKMSEFRKFFRDSLENSYFER